ncbi:MAG: hypothetical protein KF771_03565 [Burkholderiales bacterium]|nr:hypothetical protein [Burkholderiales bacterium]
MLTSLITPPPPPPPPTTRYLTDVTPPGGVKLPLASKTRTVSLPTVVTVQLMHWAQPGTDHRKQASNSPSRLATSRRTRPPANLSQTGFRHGY